MDAKKRAMIAALRISLGRVTEACASIDIARSTHYGWMKDDAEYAAAVASLNEEALDFVEGKLFDLINGHSHPEEKIFQYEGSPVIVPTIKHYPPDTAATIFYLKTKGKNRGYVERQELAGVPEAPIQIVIPDKL